MKCEVTALITFKLPQVAMILGRHIHQLDKGKGRDRTVPVKCEVTDFWEDAFTSLP